MGVLQAPDEHRFCIIFGAGIAGIIQGATFLRKKILALDDFELIDRNDGFGGVWWKNTYPGAACDIPSQVYSISWAPNPNWGKRFAPQAEIQRYYEGVALRYGLDKATSLGTEIIAARWSEEHMLWVVETENLKTGQKKIWTCNMIVSAAGQFSVPKKADIPGIDTFKPDQWHTVNWPKNARLSGKTIGVLGTGPSAAQLLPHIAPLAGRLIIYQRSPSFCLPRQEFVSSNLRKFVFSTIPFVLTVYKWWMKKQAEFLGRNVFVVGSWWQKKAIELAWGHLDAQVTDPKVREKLRSKDHFGCKRPLLLDNYYPIFNRPNVELITDRVTALGEDTIISTNSETGAKEERKVDTLIWGTGYRPDEFGLTVPTYGRTGQRINKKYADSENMSLYGISVDDFPNYFNFLGPNSLSFEASVIEEMELQTKYICDVTQYLLHKNVGAFRHAVQPRKNIVESWTLSLRDGQMKHPAAGPSCQSYYKSKNGQVYFWPHNYSGYKKLIKKADMSRDWELLSKRPGKGETVVGDCTW